MVYETEVKIICQYVYPLLLLNSKKLVLNDMNLASRASRKSSENSDCGQLCFCANITSHRAENPMARIPLKGRLFPWVQ